MSSQKRRDRTFRIRNLPSHVDRHGAIELLVRLEPSLGPTDNIRIYSLASSLNPWERPPTKMATVVFKQEPALFSSNRKRWVLPGQLAGIYRDILIDVQFLDFTVLNEPESHEFDCIAISGLASHPFGSWMERDETTNFMWLRDRLPKDMPFIRTMVYGYDTQLLNSESTQTIDDIATNFIVQLRSFGGAALSAKPLILLAHSLGGIIFKRAIVLLANSGVLERSMLDSIKQIVFFGVPHKGMEVSHLLPMVEGQPNRSLIEFLTTDSTGLKDLREQFDGIATLQNLQIVSVYETKRSQLPTEREDGTWSRQGQYELLVDRGSAIHELSLPCNILPVNEDHSNMAKFSDGDSPYCGLLNFFFDIKRTVSETKCVTRSSVAMVPNTPDRLILTNSPPEDQLDSDAMLRSLQVPEEGRRLFEIQNPAPTTFDWIYTDSNLGFRSWIYGESAIFWISGKPGSGKSTFMKYIYEDMRTHSLLQQANADRRRLIKTSFFFHDRGSHAQRSLEGLLRSILLQILKSELTLRESVLPFYRKTVKLQNLIWSMNDLEQAFAIIADQTLTPLTIVLFLDALDEYDGSPEAIISFIKSLAGKKTFASSHQVDRHESCSTRFQLCFSSRQWPVFEDHFRTCSGIKIHEHTRNDMKTYIYNTLGKYHALNQLLRPLADVQGTTAIGFVNEVVNKAKGVFLWVALIMHELHMECTNGASCNDISSILATFPEQLEEFYERTLARIPKRYRLESYVLFETVLRSVEPPRLKDLALALACAKGSSIQECSSKLQEVHMRFIEDDMARRIKSRSGGLLDLAVLERGTTSSATTTVQFVHQTMKEFVERPDFRSRILGESSQFATDNGHSFLTKLHLTLISSHFSIYREMLEISGISTYKKCYRNAFYHSHLAEKTTGKSQRSFIDTMSAVRYTVAFGFGEVINSPASFAAVADLTLYMREHLCEPSAVNSNPDWSLLYSVVKAIGLYADIWYGIDYEIRLDNMIRLLLESGADATLAYKGMTPFQLLISRASADEHQTFQLLVSRDSTEKQQISDMADAFLEHGEDPHSWTMGTAPDFSQVHSPLLHIAPIQLMRTLLKYNVYVNVLDSHGFTALDRRLQYTLSPLSRTSEAYSNYESMLLLLQHDARVTNFGAGLFDTAVARLKADLGWTPQLPRPRLVLEQRMGKGIMSLNKILNH